ARGLIAAVANAVRVVAVEREGPPVPPVSQRETARQLCGRPRAGRRRIEPVAHHTDSRKHARTDAESTVTLRGELEPHRVRRESSRIPVRGTRMIEAD